jgi:cystathionine beta-synthase
VREEGIFCGVSSGSAVVGALKYAAQHQLGEDKLVVVLLPDSGSRYLSKVFNDDWMRENSMLDPLGIGASVETLLHQRSAQKLIMATANESVQSVISKMRHYGVSQLPVVDDSQHLIGLVAEVDLLTFMIGNGSGGSVEMSLQDAGLISQSLVTVKPNTPLESLMKTFATQSVVIVQDGEEVRDIITKIDLIDFLSKSV